MSFNTLREKIEVTKHRIHLKGFLVFHLLIVKVFKK